jgi:dTDP-4-amino-4,6-dideoxygalactose transaminase
MNVPLIEDAAHAHLSYRDNYTAGTIGDIGCFSFFPTKVMTTGEGGVISTNNQKYYEKIKSLKNFGRDNGDANIIINPEGNNFKINEFTGLLGSIECDRVISRIKKRTDLLERYYNNLKNTEYSVIKQSGDGRCSYYKAIVKTPINSLWLKKYCKNNDITLTGEVYKIPIHLQYLYKKDFSYVNLPNTDYYCNYHICPPLYPELTFKEVDYICDILKQALIDYEKQNR